MVLIPNDIGIRMRLQNEAQLLQPTSPITEIASDLPDLRPGQLFTARIQEALPQGTYKALVAGKDVTLSLPEGTKAGDTLELVVVDRSAKVVVAQLAPAADPAAAGKPYPFTNLSPAAQLIGSLLPADGEAAAAVPLNAGKPVLPGPPTNASELAGALRGAVRNSGLFYEAHQAQWVTGRYPLAQLLDEPQAQHSDFTRLVEHFIHGDGNTSLLDDGTPSSTSPTLPGTSAKGDATETTPKSALVERQNTANPGATANNRQATETLTAAGNPSSRNPVQEASASTVAAPQSMPDDVRPIVQQQLDALATDRMVWHGEAWPQQGLEWQIERDAHGASHEGDNEGTRWNTSLALTTPHLGRIDARLQLSEAGLRIVIAADSPAIAENMRTALPALQNSLEAAGVPLLGFWAREAQALGEAPAEQARTPQGAGN